jgi:hypothetical protein
MTGAVHPNNKSVCGEDFKLKVSGVKPKSALEVDNFSKDIAAGVFTPPTGSSLRIDANFINAIMRVSAK